MINQELFVHLKMIFNIYKNKKVIITGNTGFKGSWLTIWLNLLGAKVYGISQPPPTKPSLYNLNNLSKIIKNRNIIDINNNKLVNKFVQKIQPDFIFHLAAQSLVFKSYDNPSLTWQTNVFGTLNILESLKLIKKKCSVIIVTSDKCYKNLEITRGYSEDDILGGIDPYSSSKAAAEILFNSYIKSKLIPHNIRICTARAGNVIGGGDWSQNRIVPDTIKSWMNKKSVTLRNPESTRPWQHVLEPISGYLQLAANLYNSKKLSGHSFNFGPSNKSIFTVEKLINEMSKLWKINKITNFYNIKKSNKKYESKLLKLNCSKSSKLLNWRQTLNFKQTVKFTVDWYIFYLKNNKDYNELTITQIYEYIQIAKKNKLRWTK